RQGQRAAPARLLVDAGGKGVRALQQPEGKRCRPGRGDGSDARPRASPPRPARRLTLRWPPRPLVNVPSRAGADEIDSSRHPESAAFDTRTHRVLDGLEHPAAGPLVGVAQQLADGTDPCADQCDLRNAVFGGDDDIVASDDIEAAETPL